MYTKRTQGYLKCITGRVFGRLPTVFQLITQSLYRGKVKFSESKNHSSLKALASGKLALQGMFLALNKELCSFSIHRGLRENLG